MEQQPVTGEGFHAHFNPKDYLKKNYTDVESTPLFSLIQRPIYDFYKSYGATNSATDGLKVLDIGCGPVIAHVISAAEYASEIVLSEYTELNRKELTKWLDNDPDAHDWTPYLRYVVTEVEGKSKEEINGREKKMKSAIKAVVPCDLKKDPVMSAEYMKEYDVVQAILCLAGASSSKQEYLLMLKRIWSLIKPGGTFVFYAAYSAQDLPGRGVYHVGNVPVSFLHVSFEFVNSSLLSAGFDPIQAIPLLTLRLSNNDYETYTLFFCKKKM